MSAGRVRRVRGVWRSAAPLALLAYALLLASGPFLHHDLSCELKSRTHCATCVAGVAGPGLASSSNPLVHELRRAGTLVTTRDVPRAITGQSPIDGRAPPVA